MITTRQHPFADLLRSVWQSLRRRCAQKEKKQTKKAEHKIKITSVYRATDGVCFFFRSSGRAMWPTVLVYITALILRTFHFSFPLLRHGPPSYSFNWCFIFSPHFVGCDCSLTENYQSRFSHFHNINAN